MPITATPTTPIKKKEILEIPAEDWILLQEAEEDDKNGEYEEYETVTEFIESIRKEGEELYQKSLKCKNEQ